MDLLLFLDVYIKLTGHGSQDTYHRYLEIKVFIYSQKESPLNLNKYCQLIFELA